MPAIPGLFGKLPVLGDFVTRRLPVPFVQAWDAWIQESLVNSREQLDAAWLEIYLTSPIWRFVLSPENCGDQAAAGILMPSVDKVGRYFPLTMAVTFEPCDVLPYLFITAPRWFEAMERLALSALEDGCRLETLDRKLKTLGLDVGNGERKPDPSCEKSESTEGDTAIRIEMERLEEMPAAFDALGGFMLKRLYSTYSLWSTAGSELLKPSLLVYRGLPPVNEFAGLLTGDWIRPGVSLPTVGPSAPIHERSFQQDDAIGSSSSDAIPAIQWRSWSRTVAGKVRTINEDAFLDNPAGGIWAVADGMGGHLAGDEASRTVIDALAAIVAGDSLENLTAKVTARLEDANAELIRRAQKQHADQIMGSTVVVMLTVAASAAAVWVGDSRLYRYRHGRLVQLTRDHAPAIHRDASERSPNQPPVKPNRSNVVTRALGAEARLDVDTITFQAAAGDRYLLCSDGLDKEVGALEIAEILGQPDVNGCSQALIDLALSRGARDNVTVVVVSADGASSGGSAALRGSPSGRLRPEQTV